MKKQFHCKKKGWKGDLIRIPNVIILSVGIQFPTFSLPYEGEPRDCAVHRNLMLTNGEGK